MTVAYTPTTRKYDMESLIMEINKVPVDKTPIYDMFFKSDVSVLDEYEVGMEEIENYVTSVRMVTPGGVSELIGNEKWAKKVLDHGMFDIKQPIPVADAVKIDKYWGANNKDGLTSYLARKGVEAKKALNRYKENWAVQAVFLSTATIITRNSEGADDTYSLNYGTQITPTITGVSNLVAAAATLGDIQSALVDFHEAIENAGGSGSTSDMITIIDGAMRAKLVALRANKKTNDVVLIEKEGDFFMIDGYKLWYNRGVYYDGGKKVALANKKYGFTNNTGEMLMIDTSAGQHKARYLKIQNLNAELKALPMFTQILKDPEGKGMTINTMSNPVILCTAIHSAKKAVNA